MSKRDEKPRSSKFYEQGDLFKDQEGAASVSTGGTSRRELRAELLSRLEAQRTLTTGMVDKISDYGQLVKAFTQVKRNKGSGGVDGLEIADYEVGLYQRLSQLQSDLRCGSYEPQAVKVVEIPKSNGGHRQLGIPTIADRVVQQSMLNVLQPIYDAYFSDYSYGFRPNRSAHQAVQQASRYVLEGKKWVVDIDLKSFFDEINHDRLMSRLSKSISDKGLLKLIHKYLGCGMMKGGLVSQRLSGTPQGGPLSPLLSNIVLDELDRELEARGLSFVRYADDCNIFVKSKRSAERVMASLIGFIEGKLKLKVNREKSGVRLCDKVKFLGHTIEEDGRIRIAEANIKRLKDKIRLTTKRNRGHKFSDVLKEVNGIIQGWGTYYRYCNTWLGTFKQLDGMIRKRLRCYALKQHKRRYPTFRFLRRLGVNEHQAWSAVMYYDWWGMANYRPVMKAMGIQWFAEQGLKSLSAIQRG